MLRTSLPDRSFLFSFSSSSSFSFPFSQDGQTIWHILGLHFMVLLLARLAAGPYMLGEHFTSVDVLFGTTFAQFAQSGLLPQSPLIDAYVQRIVSRPAFARGMARDAG